MDLDAYRQRIDYRGRREPSAETLRALHRAHLAAVPFENLDIHRGAPIVLDEAAFYDKIVRRRRGGFCYELNGLFAALLRGLGFDLDLLSARVTSIEKLGAPFDHLVLRVHLEEDWLADVGFGDSILEPLRLVEGLEQEQGGVLYRLDRAGEDWILMKRAAGADWAAQYHFDPTPRELAEFAGMCAYHQSSPESTFTHGPMITRPTAEGRVTLTASKFVVTRQGGKDEEPVEGEAEFARLLSEHFDVDLSLEDPGRHFLQDAAARFGELKRLAEGALTQVDDDAFFAIVGEEDNCLGAIVKHLAGNLRSRWTEFLTSDGEKPDRHRDLEFVMESGDSRVSLMERWESGWNTLFETLDSQDPADLTCTVRIRHEPHTVIQAVNRQLTHYGYHVGQIVQLARQHVGENWRTLSVPRGGTEAFNIAMREKHKT